MNLRYEIRIRIPKNALGVIDDTLDNLIPTVENSPETIAKAKEIILESLTKIVNAYDVTTIVPISRLFFGILKYSGDYENFGRIGRIASQEMESLSQVLGIMAPRRERNHAFLEDFPYEEEQWG